MNTASIVPKIKTEKIKRGNTLGHYQIGKQKGGVYLF